MLCGVDSMLRDFMLAAYNNGMTNGDYVYIITGLLPAPNLVNRWSTGDALDGKAQLAFQSALQVFNSSFHYTDKK